jgi:AcrR family transcriptional regulator
MHPADRILRAAVRLYERDGERGVSIRNVAAAVGLSPMALYRHYAGRDDLLAAIAAEAFAVWEARVQAVRGKDARAWLARLSEAYLRFALDEPRRYEACFVLPSRTARRIPADFAAGRSPAARVITERIAEGLARGELRGPDALTIGLVVWAEAHGLILLHRDGRFGGDRRVFTQTYRRCLRVVLAAFTAERAT